MGAPKASELRETFAFNVRKVRRRLGLSQEELAHKAKFSRNYITEIETGKRNVSLDNLDKLARALGVHPIELLLPTRSDVRVPQAPASDAPVEDKE